MAKTTALTLALVAAAAAAVAANNSPHLRLSRYKDYDAFSDTTRFSPLGEITFRGWSDDEKAGIETLKEAVIGDIPLTDVRLDPADRITTAKADCKGIVRSLAELKNPVAMRFTLDAARTTGVATMVKFAALLEAQHARDRAAFFTVIDDGTTPADFFAPLRHDYGDNAFVGDVMPRVYDPRTTGRPLVVVVPEAQAAAFRAALHGGDNDDIALVHVVGVLPRAADDGDQPQAGSFAGRGFMRHAAVTLMRALRTADNLLVRAWLVDHDTVAVAHKEMKLGGGDETAKHGVIKTHEHWQLLETFVAAHREWNNFAFHLPETRRYANPAAVAADFPNARTQLLPGAASTTMNFGGLVNLQKLAAASSSFPTAFAKGREDEALLHQDSDVTNVKVGVVRNLVAAKASVWRPALPMARDHAEHPERNPKFRVIDASSLANLFVGSSAADFVMRNVRAPCPEINHDAAPAALMDAAALALGNVFIECMKGVDPDLPHERFSAYSTHRSLRNDHDVNLLEFFRLTPTLHVVEA